MKNNLNMLPYSKNIEGEGVFKTNMFEETRAFELSQYPHRTMLRTSFRNSTLLVINEGLLKLEGKLKDGSSIRVDAMQIKRLDKYSAVLIPRTPIFIGNGSVEDIYDNGEFSVRGYAASKNISDVLDGNWKYSIQRIAGFSQEHEIFQDGFQVALDTHSIILQNSIGATLEQFKEKCNSICMILSLATNNALGYNRFTLNKNDAHLEVWQPKKSGDFRPVYPCVAEDDHRQLLETSIPIYCTFNNNETKLYHTVIDYLCSTNTGYLEDGMLRATQAWEAYFNENETEKYELPLPLPRLKSLLKQTIKDWKITVEYQNFDPKGFVSNRLITSLYWNKLVDGLENLTDKNGLDKSQINIDFRTLVDVRNSIAHSGRFREKGREKEYASLFESAILGLQLLLLRRVGYEGNISAKDKTGWRGFRQIGEYFLN